MAKTQIKITNYNTHLFYKTAPAIAASYQDATRLDEIIAKLSNASSDILTLDEVWADSSKEKIKKSLLARFPYCYYPTKKKNFFKVGSGLMILSKYPIGNASFTQYKSLVDDDSMSQKGFIQATIKNKGGSKILLNLISTHTQAGASSEDIKVRTANFKQVYDAIHKLDDGKTPMFLTGDLNVIGGSREYIAMNDDFNKRGMIDAFRYANPNARTYRGYTYDGLKNKLIPQFVPEDRTIQQRLDYIYVNSKKADISIDKAQVLHSLTYVDSSANTLMDLSDHYPLTGIFTLS